MLEPGVRRGQDMGEPVMITKWGRQGNSCLKAPLEVVVGLSGPMRRPLGRPSQVWVMVGLDLDKAALGSIRRAAGGTRDKVDGPGDHRLGVKVGIVARMGGEWRCVWGQQSAQVWTGCRKPGCTCYQPAGSRLRCKSSRVSGTSPGLGFKALGSSSMRLLPFWVTVDRLRCPYLWFAALRRDRPRRTGPRHLLCDSPLRAPIRRAGNRPQGAPSWAWARGADG